MSHYFNISRFWLLLKMEVQRSRKGLVMTLVIIFGFLFFMGLLMTPVFEPELKIFDHHDGYAFTLIGAGLILSSMSFRDLGSTLKRFHYLTLPVSALEKFLSMWLLTSVGWIVFYTAFYLLYTLFANIVGQILYSHITFVPFKPFGGFTLTIIRYYFVTQGILLVGAAHFKGYVFPKTLFTLILFALVCGSLVYLFMNPFFDSDVECLSETNTWEQLRIFKILMAFRWAFWWLLAPLCWIITYYGIKEKEV